MYKEFFNELDVKKFHLQVKKSTMIEYQLNPNTHYICHPGRHGPCTLNRSEMSTRQGNLNVTFATNAPACLPPQFWNLNNTELKLGNCPELFTLHQLGNKYKAQGQNGLFIGPFLKAVNSLDHAVVLTIPRIGPSGAPVEVTWEVSGEVKNPAEIGGKVEFEFCCGCVPGRPLSRVRTFMVCTNQQIDKRCLVSLAEC